MGVQFKSSGVVLFSASGTVAMDPACCCGPAVCCDNTLVSWTVTASPGETGCCSILEGTYTPDETSSGCVYRRTVNFSTSDLCNVGDTANCYLQYYTYAGVDYVIVTNVISVTFEIELSNTDNTFTVTISGQYRRATINLDTDECFVENDGNPQDWTGDLDDVSQLGTCGGDVDFGMAPSFTDIITGVTQTFCSGAGPLTISFEFA